jgi:hypothetical protein
VWFRLNVGREKNADPKWLIPLICRQGHVTKQDIGLDQDLRPRHPLRDLGRSRGEVRRGGAGHRP